MRIFERVLMVRELLYILIHVGACQNLFMSWKKKHKICLFGLMNFFCGLLATFKAVLAMNYMQKYVVAA